MGMGIAKTLLVAGLLVFLAKALITNWNRIAGYTWDISPVPLAISFIFLILFYLASFLLWENLCRGIGVKFSTGMNLSIWFFSQVGKYVPGKIWGPVGRVYLAEQQGVRKIDMGICLAYEAVLKKYPKSEKAQGALLKQGFSFVEIGDKKTGKTILEKLVEIYPESREAELAKKKIEEIEKSIPKKKK